MQDEFGMGVPNFLLQRNPEFKELNGATDRHYWDLRAKGIGAEKKRAQPLSEEDILMHCTHSRVGQRSRQGLDQTQLTPESFYEPSNC